VIEFAVALLLWLLVFVPSSIVASLTYREARKSRLCGSTLSELS